MTVNVVIKFGGSAITDKNQLETLKPEKLRSACELIQACIERRLSCIVVHGAGSFGHHHAKKHKVNEGWTGIDPDQTAAINNVKRGICLTRQSVTKLHQYVISSLLDEGIQAVGMPSYGLWESDRRSVTKHGLQSILTTIEHGLVPVVHGDVILDTSLGCTILSGDTIIQTICEECNIDRVVFMTSVDGVYNEPPEDNPDAVLQKSIFVNKAGNIIIKENQSQILSSENSSSEEGGIVSGNVCNDVTGGMTLKLKTACDIVSKTEGKTSVFICKLGSLYAMDVCLNGRVTDVENVGTAVSYLDT